MKKKIMIEKKPDKWHLQVDRNIKRAGYNDGRS